LAKGFRDLLQLSIALQRGEESEQVHVRLRLATGIP